MQENKVLVNNEPLLTDKKIDFEKDEVLILLDSKGIDYEIRLSAGIVSSNPPIPGFFGVNTLYDKDAVKDFVGFYKMNELGLSLDITMDNFSYMFAELFLTTHRRMDALMKFSCPAEEENDRFMKLMDQYEVIYTAREEKRVLSGRVLTDEEIGIAEKMEELIVMGMAKDKEAEGDETAVAEGLGVPPESYDVVAKDSEGEGTGEWTFNTLDEATEFADLMMQHANDECSREDI